MDGPLTTITKLKRNIQLIIPMPFPSVRLDSPLHKNVDYEFK